MLLALKLIGLVVVTTYMLQAGLATPKGRFAAGAWRKGELARALVVMLVLGPLVARLLAAAFALEPRPAAALVLLSLVGVVPLASRGARSARGDVPYAVVLTAALGIVTAFTAAPTTRLLLGYHGPLEVRTGALVLQVMLLQGVPLAIGMFIRAKPERTRALERVLGIFNVAAIVVLVVVAVVLLPRYGAVRSLGWNGALAAVRLRRVHLVDGLRARRARARKAPGARRHRKHAECHPGDPHRHERRSRLPASPSRSSACSLCVSSRGSRYRRCSLAPPSDRRSATSVRRRSEACNVARCSQE